MYCLSPSMEQIPENTWFCPECQLKQTSEVLIENQHIYKDRNYTFDDQVLSKPALSAVKKIVESLKKKEKSFDTECLFKSLSISDLIQIQSCMWEYWNCM